MPYTPFHRIIDALEHRPSDHVPVLPLLAGWAGAHFSKIPPAQISGDARRIAEVQIKAQEALGFDGLFGYLDPLYIPEAFGCPVQFTPVGPLIRPTAAPTAESISRQVGETGRVIGVDMTPEMLAKARENARKGGFTNVEFRLGEIENLPAADDAVDLIISNCVINLAPDKKRVFREAYRVLKPGGRIMISDLVWLQEIPKALLESVGAYVACLSGAVKREAYLEAVVAAEFEKVRVVEETPVPFDLFQGDPLGQTITGKLNLSPEQFQAGLRSVVSVKVEAWKPVAV
jgi:SAM-dependent methyltransferase